MANWLFFRIGSRGGVFVVDKYGIPIVIWGSLMLTCVAISVIALTDSRSASGRVRRSRALWKLKRQSTAGKKVLRHAKSQASDLALSWNQAMLDAQGNYYHRLGEAERELFFAVYPRSGQCRFETDLLRIFDQGVEAYDRQWPFTELASEPRLVGAGGTLRTLRLVTVADYRTSYDFDAAGGRMGMADTYAKCSDALHNAWVSFQHSQDALSERLASAKQQHALALGSLGELPRLVDQFLEASEADPTLKLLWEAQVEVMELDLLIAELDFELRFGSNWLDKTTLRDW